MTRAVIYFVAFVVAIVLAVTWADELATPSALWLGWLTAIIGCIYVIEYLCTYRAVRKMYDDAKTAEGAAATAEQAAKKTVTEGEARTLAQLAEGEARAAAQVAAGKARIAAYVAEGQAKLWASVLSDLEEQYVVERIGAPDYRIQSVSPRPK